MNRPPHTLSFIEYEAADLTQLQMTLPHLDALPPARAVDGYALRGFRGDPDEAAWLRILNTGDFGTWDRPRLERMLAGERAPLPRESIVFATHDDFPVGVANAFAYDDGRRAELGWVAVLPEHRGRGLSVSICREVLACARDAGFTRAFLSTEDFRLGAIKTYLRLGFEPVITPEQAARWDAIREAIGPATA